MSPAEIDAWVLDVQNALAAATTIGMRSCNPHDHLNYGNHDRLIAIANDVRAALKESAA
jgi:hypothetical protein